MNDQAEEALINSNSTVVALNAKNTVNVCFADTAVLTVYQDQGGRWDTFHGAGRLQVTCTQGILLLILGTFTAPSEAILNLKFLHTSLRV